MQLRKKPEKNSRLQQDLNPWPRDTGAPLMLGAGQLCVDMFPAARAQGEALDNIYSFLKQNINLCNAKRRRQRERWKITIGLIISQKSKFARALHFWTFLCCCFARLQSETRRNFLVTRVMEEMSYVFLFTLFLFFFHCGSFLLWWPPGISHFLTAATKFSCFLPTEKCLPLFSLSRCSSLSFFFSLNFADLSPTFSFSLSFSLSIFQIWGHDNLSLIL